MKTIRPRLGIEDIRNARPINLMIGTAGHVDHGKTRLTKALTGCDTDRLPEEKERGMSIELGFAPCLLRGGRKVGIVDVPGHERFVRKMVAGAVGIDVLLLVIAADDGVMPQTLEHFRIAESLGVSHGLIALTKIDLVSPERREEVLSEIIEAFQNTFLDGKPLLPVSMETGEGFDAFYDALNRVLDETPPRDDSGVFRLPIERIFTQAGFGTVVTGIQAGGRVCVGDTLELWPEGRKVRVRGIEVYGEPAEAGSSGQCVALNLADLSVNEAGRGWTLAAPGLLKPTTRFTARLDAFRHRSEPIRQNQELRVHAGTQEILGQVRILEGETLPPGGTSLCQMDLAEPIVLVPGEHIVLRIPSPADTVAGGIVIERGTRKLKRTRLDAVESLKSREKAMSALHSWVEFLLKESPGGTASVEDLVHETLASRDKIGAVLSELTRTGTAIPLSNGNLWIHRETQKRFIGAMEGRMETLHREKPNRIGFEWLEMQSGLPGTPEALRSALDRLIEEGRARVEGSRYSLACWEQNEEDEGKYLAAVEDLFLRTGYGTPRPDELPDHLPNVPDPVACLNILVERGRIIRLSEKAYIHTEYFEKARKLAIDTILQNGDFDSGEFKNLLGTTRKYAIPLLDALDKFGWTRRVGNMRVLGDKARREVQGGKKT